MEENIDSVNGSEEPKVDSQKNVVLSSVTSKTGSSLSTAVPLLSKHAIDSESRSNSMSVVSALGSDPYSEDETELQFLQSKPTCFILLGKPGIGKTSLARNFAHQWKCILINSTDLILQNIAFGTEIGIKCSKILACGGSVSEEIILRIIQEKIESPEVAHHGYILDDFPCLSEITMTITDQLELIKSWKLKPDFIISIMLKDTDLYQRRSGQKVDPTNGDVYTREMYAPEKFLKKFDSESGDEADDDEEEAEDEEVEGSAIEMPVEVVERLVHRAEDMTPNLDASLKTYRDRMLKIFEDYMSDHDQQFLIKMDGNQTPMVLLKQLLSKLECHAVRPAAVPLRLYDVEEEEVPEDLETDELLRTLAATRMVAPRFRWRRSRWLQYCPVALFNGNFELGRAEFSVSFLDKLYCLSSQEAMETFLRNPRPFLLPPQPRIPCRLSVLGPPLSGTSTLCHLLAHKYGAKVLDVDSIIRPHLDEEKRKMVFQVKEEATESAINAVRIRLKVEAEAAAAEAVRLAAEMADKERQERMEAEAEAEHDDQDGSEDDHDGDQKNFTDVADESREHSTTADVPQHDSPGGETPVDIDTPGVAVESSATMAPVSDAGLALEIEVDESHPDVVNIVSSAVDHAEKQSVTLTADVIVSVVVSTISDMEKEMYNRNPHGPRNGGWILDNFPSTRELWNACVEKNLFPDDLISLSDNSNQGTLLANRFYTINKADVDTAVRTRRQRVEERKRLEDEARLEEERQRLMEEQARQSEEDERLQSLQEEDEEEEGGIDELTDVKGVEKESEPSDELEEGSLSPVVEDEIVSQESKEQIAPSGVVKYAASKEEMPLFDAVDVSMDDDAAHLLLEPMIPDCPEMDRYYQLRQQFDKEHSNVLVTMSSSTMIEPVIVDLEGKMVEDVFDESIQLIEKNLRYTGWEYSGLDVDEEEEDLDAEAAAAEEEDEDYASFEEEDPNRNRKKPLGETNHFCPIALNKSNILFPGNPEIAVKYKDKVYYFSTNEARDEFLESPETFLPTDKPFQAPPLRLLILGARGSGKSFHGRRLAEKHGLFHIAFKERLQEIIIAKTKHRIGPDIDTEAEEEEEDVHSDDELLEVDSEAVVTEGTQQDIASSADVMSKISETAETESKEPEEELELTDEEEAIKLSLENTDTLSSEILDKILPEWWHKEPFKSSGFVLEGFPRTADEALYMAEMGLFPDAAIIMNVSDGDVIGRLLPPKMDRWRVRRDKRLEKKAKRKEKKRIKKERSFPEKVIHRRREELLKEREAARAAEGAAEDASMKEEESDEEGDGDEEDEEEAIDDDEDDIEAILAEEFEDEEELEEEEEELVEDASERIRNELNEVYDDDINHLDNVLDVLEEILIPRLEVDAGRKPHIVRYIITKKLEQFTRFRRSIFERVYAISENVATLMIQTGYKQPSRFGRWCPVKLLEGDRIQPMNGPGFPTYPCMYRQHIYFLSSASHRKAFIKDPLSYVRQPSPGPVVPVKLAIIGPPKCGKTTLAKRFEEEYGVVRLSVGDAMRQVLLNQPQSHLAITMTSALHCGEVVPDELQIASLEVMMLDMRVQTRGYVLDGYPLTVRQTELLHSRGILPVSVINMELGGMEVMVRGVTDRCNLEERTLPLHTSAKVLQLKVSAFRRNVAPIVDWYRSGHNNVICEDACRSKWLVWESVLEHTQSSIKKIQIYLQRISHGDAASIADLCIRPSEFRGRLGDYDQYCPVKLSDGQLVDCSVSDSLQYAAEFRGHYYKMAGEEELKEFLANPEKFVPPRAPRKLPAEDLLPKRLTRGDLSTDIVVTEMRGYCPVTFVDGKMRYESIVSGDPELLVVYRGKFYCMESEEKLLKFMRLPDTYWNYQLPHKLPPCKQELPVSSLPILGFLEQAVAVSLITALTAVGNVKPKYPFQTPTRSALLYLAYYLKAFNIKSSDYIRKKYKQKLDKFEETCNLIRFLGDNMTHRYRDPSERQPDLNSKLEVFFALKDIEPTPSWIC